LLTLILQSCFAFVTAGSPVGRQGRNPARGVCESQSGCRCLLSSGRAILSPPDWRWGQFHLQSPPLGPTVRRAADGAGIGFNHRLYLTGWRGSDSRRLAVVQHSPHRI